METMEQRMVAAARGWVGTRFHHQGRLKAAGGHGGGVDCLGLLVGVAGELALRGRDGALLSCLDRPDYGHFPDSAALAGALEGAMTAVPPAEIRPGDILLLEVGGRAQHLGIVGAGAQGLTLIHAYAPARRVVEHALDGWWRGKVAGVYRLRPAEEAAT